MAFNDGFVKSNNPRAQIQDEKKAKGFAPPVDELERLDVFIGKVSNIVYSKPESGFFIASMTLPKGEIPPRITVGGRPWLGKTYTVKGVSKAFLEKKRNGSDVECYGKWVEDPDYGIQFDARFINEKLPNSPEALEAFLKSGKIHGLGGHYAKLIVQRWGVEAIGILDNTPDDLSEIPGIGPKRLETIKVSWKTYRGVYNIMSFMQMHGIGDSVGLRIYTAFGENAIRVIEQNPYSLTKVPMVGFRTADRIAKSLGVSPRAPYRIESALKFVLDEAAKNDGHTALSVPDLASRAADMMELDDLSPINAIIEKAITAGALIARTLRVKIAIRERYGDRVMESEQRCVSTRGLVTTEKRIASDLKRLLEATGAKSVDLMAVNLFMERGLGDLDESQSAAISNSFNHKMSIITGGPGTGKTHSIKSILTLAESLGMSVFLTAPTGRAAKRMEEATGHRASTMHRLLAYSPDVGFKFNDEVKLKGDLFIVDESSMIDVWLMSAFLKAVPDGATVIFVGDVDQLPSVGAGNALSDLIECSAVKVSRLTHIHRQAANSRIIVNAHKIIRKQYPDLPPITDETSDFVFVESSGNAKIQEDVIALATRLIEQGVPAGEIQVISPQKGTEVGTVDLNQALRMIMNPQAKDFEFSLEDGSKIKFAPGDRVMQFKNNYDLDIFNGDVGFVVDVDRDSGTVLVDFDDKELEIGGGQIKDLQLAYAITIHKSQGTEHGHVIIPLSKSHQFMFTPNLLYTAVTRGKKRVYLVGERQVVAGTVKAQERMFRITGLREEISMAVIGERECDALFGE